MVPKILSKPTPEERFWAKVTKSDDCWEWTGSRGNYGHGALAVDGRNVGAHRFSYELAIGPIPTGLVIDHMCHNPPCVNPAHLRAVTHKQNIENQVGAHRTSRSGIRGVRFDPRRNKWRAEIKHHGNRINVGSFSTAEAAQSAVIDARNILFTHNDSDRK
jgi:hypothetical protein